jgi:hypothetical protein
MIKTPMARPLPHPDHPPPVDELAVILAHAMINRLPCTGSPGRLAAAMAAIVQHPASSRAGATLARAVIAHAGELAEYGWAITTSERAGGRGTLVHVRRSSPGGAAVPLPRNYRRGGLAADQPSAPRPDLPRLTDHLRRGRSAGLDHRTTTPERMTIMAPRHFKRLITAVDQDNVPMPAAFNDRRLAKDRLTDASVYLGGNPPPSPGELYDRAVAAVLAADDPLAVDLGPIADNEAAHAEYNRRNRILLAAVKQAEQDLIDSVHDHAEDIRAGIAANGEELWQRITAAVRALGDLDLNNGSAVVAAPDKARKAFLALQADLAPAYTRLRAALSEVPLAPAQWDTRGDHATLKIGYCQALGDNWAGSAVSARAPVPPWGEHGDGLTTTLHQLVWFVRNGHQPWYADGPARDAAWQAAHPDQYAEATRQQRLHGGVHALSAEG